MANTKQQNNSNWIWNLIRGLLALGLGLFLIFGTQTAPIAIAWVLGIYLALSGLLQTIQGFVNRRAAGSGTDRIRGLVGLIGGAVLIVLGYFEVLSLAATYTLLAVILIAYGLLGLFEAILDRGASQFRWMPVIVNLLLVLLGVMIFVSRARDFDLRLWSGIALAILGIVILGYVYISRRAKQEELPVGM